MKKKKIVSLGLVTVMTLGLLSTAGCGSGGTDSKSTFSWWIYKNDGNGLYENYAENPSVQWVNQQTWDVENGTIAKDGEGKELHFTFQEPIAGSETDNFNTMMGTGDYTDIIDLCVSADNDKTLAEEGQTLELTEYIEKWCPNYVEFLEKNPDVKNQVTYTDEDGKVHYYSIAAINDGVEEPWSGYVYRRDWVVKYCQPTDYIWDWDSAYVKENGHPAVTPLSEAKAQNNLEGWKANDVKEFKVLNDGGDDPSNNYEDNVIFPSGKTDPYTISDWEWMFEGFSKAIADRGWTDDKDAYCTTVVYSGFMQMGDLVSSFGHGNGTWAKDAEGNVEYTGKSENFKTYLEAMNNWYNKGWLDKAFPERGGDMFFNINEKGFTTGKVGLWVGYTSNMGEGIRVTCLNEEDAKDAFVMGCALPINDVYGGDAQKYKEPDALYQPGRVSSRTAITEKAKDKDLETLFTFFNWLYTEEGAAARKLGLTKEQMESVEIEDNLYAENGIESAYTLETDENGQPVYHMNFDMTADICGNLTFSRMGVGITKTGVGADLGYTLDKGYSKAVAHAIAQWGAYTSTANVGDYNSQMSTEDNKTYADVSTPLTDYINQTIPKLIKEGLGGWDEYVEKLDSYNVDSISEIYEKYVK